MAPDWLPAILARFAADPGLAALGGDIRVYPAEPGRPAPAEAYEAVYAFRQQLYIERQGYSVTANIAVRRAVFEAVGGFGGIGIAEDNDWGQRAGRLGFRTVYAPEVLVRHPARATLAEIEAKWARLISHHHAAEARGLAGPRPLDAEGAGARRLAAGRDPADRRLRPARLGARAPARLPGAGGGAAVPRPADARGDAAPRRPQRRRRWNRR